jgi:NAD(P)-dependent dehydrogenase (short-subunit alcohol dehydrogenase family)
LARFGRVDAIVNSAADTRFYGRVSEIWHGDDYAQNQMLINCIAPFQLISAIHQSSWKDDTHENAKWNRNVINVSSVSALQVSENQGQAFYGASKAALNMLTMYLSLELAPYSVRVNAICPGRFVEATATDVVVKSIRKLLVGTSTGLVVSGQYA